MSSSPNRRILTVASGVALLVLGLYLLKKKDVHSSNVVGKVAKVESLPGAHGGEVIKLTVNYQMGTTSLTGVVNAKFGKTYAVGDTVVIYYNPDSPGDLTLSPMNYKVLGGIVLVISALIFYHSSQL